MTYNVSCSEHYTCNVSSTRTLYKGMKRPKYNINFLKSKPVVKAFDWQSAIRLLGFWLVCFSVTSFVLAVFPLVKLESGYQLRKLRKINFSINAADLPKLPVSFADLASSTSSQAEQLITPVDRQFSLVIPKIGVNSKVFANVDTADEAKYSQVLTLGLAHAAGTSLPGQKGPIYIFGHSASLDFNLSEVNAVFYLLDKLEPGDEVDVFYNGWHYTYQVSDKKITAPEDTSYLENKGEEILILQTCWPPGTRWQRLVVEAKPVQDL